ncbi:MAG: hypothetical protein IPP79_20670 [Chitinophagaceae bacterium]|nr:hypothetical protein [Chitinophagaceae bacterium]
MQPLNRLSRGLILGLDLPIDDLKLLVEGLKEIKKTYDSEQVYTRRDITLLQYQLDEFLTQLKEVLRLSVASLERQQNIDIQIKQKKSTYRSFQKQLIERIVNTKARLESPVEKNPIIRLLKLKREKKLQS